MLIKKETEYAILGLMALAKLTDNYHDISEVSQKAGLPPIYLAKIFQKLIKANLLESKLGSSGGFKLPKNAHGISLLDIIKVVQDEKTLKCLDGRARYCSSKCKLKTAICELEQQIDFSLKKITLKKLI